jgi:hypothetical protein
MPAPVEIANGTANGATVGSTTTTLSTQTTAAYYQLVVDLSEMVNGDAVELKILTKTLTGSTEQVEFSLTYSNIQVEPVVRSPMLPVLWSWKATLKQTTGSARDFDWSVVKIT